MSVWDLVTTDYITWPIKLIEGNLPSPCEEYKVGHTVLYVWRGAPQVTDDLAVTRWANEIPYRTVPCWVLTEFLLEMRARPRSEAARMVAGSVTLP